MRDYSFGNFIGALRIRRGLSQYQLGALVHVFDKAVSKWENGASKGKDGSTEVSGLEEIGTFDAFVDLSVTFSEMDGWK